MKQINKYREKERRENFIKLFANKFSASNHEKKLVKFHEK